MQNKKNLRALFCIGIQQSFFDADPDEAQAVWQAFIKMWEAIHALPDVNVLGSLDDDQSMVGASQGWPWTTYLLADVPDIESVYAACNLFRTTVVGDGPYKLWKYCKVEARVGHELIMPH